MKQECEAPTMTSARKQTRTDEIIDQWFGDHIPNSPVSRTTEGYNHLRVALEDLKKRLAAA